MDTHQDSISKLSLEDKMCLEFGGRMSLDGMRILDDTASLENNVRMSSAENKRVNDQMGQGMNVLMTRAHTGQGENR